MTATGYFVTGTDTGVGKTVATVALIHALAARGLRVAGLKPVACGAESGRDGLFNEDARLIMDASNVSLSYPQVNPILFEPPIAPHIAATEAGRSIELDEIISAYQLVKKQADRLVIEGVGGWQVPLGPTTTTAELARQLGLPVILVVGIRLGCLNHALLTRDAIARSGLPLAGWIANRIQPEMERAEENIASLEARIDAPLIASFPWFGDQIPDGASLARRLEPEALTGPR